MKLSKSAIIALTALSLSAVSAHAENDDFGHKSKGWVIPPKKAST